MSGTRASFKSAMDGPRACGDLVLWRASLRRATAASAGSETGRSASPRRRRGTRFRFHGGQSAPGVHAGADSVALPYSPRASNNDEENAMQSLRNRKRLTCLAVAAALAGGLAAPAWAQDSGKHWAVVGSFAHSEPTGDGTIDEA